MATIITGDPYNTSTTRNQTFRTLHKETVHSGRMSRSLQYPTIEPINVISNDGLAKRGRCIKYLRVLGWTSLFSYQL